MKLHSCIIGNNLYKDCNMSNYSELSVMNNKSGEFVYDLNEKKRKSLYLGPRKYWRTMMMYDEALLTVPTEVGIRLMLHLKNECNTSDYSIVIKIKELATIFKCNDRSLRNNLNKLLEKEYLKKITNEYYMINPDLFWIKDITDQDWQKLKTKFSDLAN